ncbi:MAG TPA: DUF6702 family protein [Chitinophagaceae bacterium]|nr:DUF6702 family protein [Chitinophagaceae bacterium]
MTLPSQPQTPVINIALSRHPYYISVTQIEYNQQQKTIEISCKLFADDFEMALKKIYNKPIDLSASREITGNKTLINEYILKRLRLEFDGKVINPQYVGYEKEGEAVYVYFEAPGVGNFKNLNLRNSILQDYTNEQINIVHVLVNGKRQSTKLTHSELTSTFYF